MLTTIMACACTGHMNRSVLSEEYSCRRVYALPDDRSAQFECDSLTVSVDLELPVGSDWQDARDRILSRIIPEKSSQAKDTLAIQAKMNMLRNDYVAEFRDFVMSFPEDYRTFEYYYSYEGMFVDPYKECLTYKIICDTYTGGAHGMTTESYLTFDSKNGRQLFLEDMVPGLSSEEIRGAALSRLRDMEGFDESFILYDPSVVYTENVYYTNDGVTFVYQPYEVACYAVGIVEVLVPWHDFEALSDADASSLK